jgi:hypothetical protein
MKTRFDENKSQGELGEMKLTDGWLLLKKILVGIVITVVPLAIVAGGLWSIQGTKLKHTQAKPTSSAKVPYAN